MIPEFKKCLPAILMFIAASGFIQLNAEETVVTDNVVIDTEFKEYEIKDNHGEISCVKVIDETTYSALRSDSYADALTMYNDHISVDKASAPGAKAYYRSWESSDVFYDGSRICYMRVPLKKGKKAKATFNLTYKDPEHFCRILLVSPYYTFNSKTVVRVPASLAARIHVTPRNLADDITFRSETLSDGSVTYTAETSNRQRYPVDPGAPSLAVSAPQLIVTGAFRDLGSLYRYIKKFAGNEEYDASLTKLASDIAARCKDRKAVIDSITDWVRPNIRYLAIEHGEYAFRPDDASEVLRKRAGDCKGSANLIKALLRLNGLDGRLVWIGTRDEAPYDWDSVPALCSGNHVIAACMLPDTILYIDGTATWARPGYIPPSIRGRKALIEDDENYILSVVPDPGTKEDSEHLTADFRIEGGSLKGKISLTLSGVRRVEFLATYANSEPRDRDMICKKILAFPKKNSEVADVSVTYGDTAVTLSAEIEERYSVTESGDKIYLDLRPMREAMMDATDTSARRAGLEVPYGYVSSYVYSIRIPEGYRIESVPESVTINDDWHKGTLSYTVEEDRIQCRCEVSTKSLSAEREEIPKRNKGILTLKKASDSQLTLVRLS